MSVPKKKLYWLHPHFYNSMGGHKFIFEVIGRLKRQHNLDVVVITAGMNERSQTEFEQLPVPVIKLFKLSTNSPLYWILLPLMLLLEKMYLIYIKKIDRSAIFVSSMFPSNTLANSISSRTYQLCYEPFAFFYDTNFINGFSYLQKVFIAGVTFLYKKLDLRSVRKCAAIFTISQANADWISQAYGVESTIVYEGVDSKFFKPTSNQTLQRQYRHQSIIFHATDYTEIKGTKYLIKALPQIIKEVPSVHLVISETLPNSPAKKGIVQLIHDLGVSSHVTFAGFLPYELLPAYLSLAKVVVQPSIRQSMNLTVKEAMACQTPIVTSLDGHEQTENGEAGYLIDPHDTSSLAKAIIKCLADAKRSRAMGKIGRARILKQFSWESVVEKIWRTIAHDQAALHSN